MAEEMINDVLDNGLESAFSAQFPGCGDYAFSAGISLPSVTSLKERGYEWKWINPTTQRLVKRTSPR